MVKQRGFSLIELMIVVAIFSVLAVVGFGLTRETLPRYRAYSAAEQFAGNVAKCRMVAIRSGYECRILMSDYDDDPTDLNGDNTGEYYLQLGNKNVQADDFETLPTSLMEVEVRSISAPGPPLQAQCLHYGMGNPDGHDGWDPTPSSSPRVRGQPRGRF